MFFHNITRTVRFNMDASVNEAALLLQEVAQLASKELSQQGEKRKRVEIVSPRESSESWSSSDESDSSQSVSPSDSPDYRQGRIRTVSVSSPVLVALRVEGLGMSPLPPPPWTLQSRRVWLQSHKVRLVTPPPKALAPPSPPRFPVLDRPGPTLRHVIHTAPELEINSSTKPKYVGMHTPRKQVLGVLQRKFTWKNYPELEDFLIEKREEYLRHSSTYNYTATQKEFNNELTNQLLDRASSLGYIFDRFLYVEVRDRIRCYYKSYLQSLKKQKA